ncbi:MAG TPA: B12-binding domain-containing protein [Acidimicrobiales bacterium]|nr:B12-binding domain-containing protein [Acidimicrobiales bacterium]
MDLHTAADRLGVHYQTAYRWVRDGSLRALKRGSVYEIDEGELARFSAARSAPAPPPKQATVRSWSHHVDRLFALLAEGDELAARHLVDRLNDGGIEPLVVCEELLRPTLGRVGDAWAEGEVSVAVEHRAAQICERLVARLAVHPRGRPRGVAVIGTHVGEEHSLPAAMAALVLRADRWQVHHVGTEVPTPDLIDLVRALRADLVVLSPTNPAFLEDAQTVAERVSRQTGARVLVGAPGARLGDLVAWARKLD